MKPMLLNFIRLFTGTFLGSFATFINIKQTDIGEFVNFHLAVANGLTGLIIGILTIVFLYWQIRKIKRDFKLKKKPNE